MRDPTRREDIALAANEQLWMADAPIILVFLACPSYDTRKYGDRGAHLYCVQDATIAASYTQLAATALDLGCCWVGAFSESRVMEIIGKKATHQQAQITETSRRPVCLMPIGYPSEAHVNQRGHKRRPIEEIVKLM